MQQYLDLLRIILDKGEEKPDRTGTGTYSVFGHQMRFDLAEGFPLITTKKIHWKSVVYELLWFLQGSTNVKYLQEHGVRIWDEWADETGELGPIYGKQWRRWSGIGPDGGPVEIDQLSSIIEQIKREPYSRRHIVSAWNVVDIPNMHLPPCPVLYQYYVNNGQISTLVYMRSADAFLGVPFDVASYALLLYMVAQCTGLVPHEVIFSLGDAHLYKNHITQAALQVERNPLPLPTIKLNPEIKHINDFKFEDIALLNYQSHPHIPAKVSI